jgi:DNA-binding HxlR family transcriptional regulator
VLGRPWTGLILTVLQAGPLRFSEIGDRARGPGEKVLSARLKDLEARGLILRRVEPGPPVRVAYELTNKGRSARSPQPSSAGGARWSPRKRGPALSAVNSPLRYLGRVCGWESP